MKILTDTLRCLAVVLMLAGHGASANPLAAGQIEFVAGSAQVTTEAGKSHQARKGETVNEGDTLATASGAAVQVRMQDGGMIAIRPESRLKIDSFRFNGKEDGSEQSFFSLLKGGFRAVTGLIGQHNKANYRIVTPTVTIGIRGTDHETLVVAPGSPLAASVAPGTYNKVNRGETSMTNGKGEIAIQSNQMGFAAADQAPQLLPLNLNIFTVTPAPQAGAGGQGEKMRDNAVVDGGVYAQAMGLAFVMPAGVAFVRFPITATYQTAGAIVCGVACFQGPPVTNTVIF